MSIKNLRSMLATVQLEAIGQRTILNRAKATADTIRADGNLSTAGKVARLKDALGDVPAVVVERRLRIKDMVEGILNRRPGWDHPLSALRLAMSTEQRSAIPGGLAEAQAAPADALPGLHAAALLTGDLPLAYGLGTRDPRLLEATPNPDRAVALDVFTAAEFAMAQADEAAREAQTLTDPAPNLNRSAQSALASARKMQAGAEAVARLQASA